MARTPPTSAQEDDDSFLDRVANVCQGDFCALLPADLQRLCTLAGYDLAAANWRGLPPEPVTVAPQDIYRVVLNARHRLRTRNTPPTPNYALTKQLSSAKVHMPPSGGLKERRA
jgi:hypothetical protein